jgi:hypothetical protein
MVEMFGRMKSDGIGLFAAEINLTERSEEQGSFVP